MTTIRPAAALTLALAAISCAGAPSAPVESPPAVASQPGPQQAAGARSSTKRPSVAAEFTDVTLSPAAAIQAEKFKCVCGCDMILGQCTCKQTPGSIDMKKRLQALVDLRLPPEEIEKGMVESYGPQVLP